LSEDAAKKYFATTDAVDKILMVKEDTGFVPYKVTAVAKRCPQNSSLQFDVLLPFKVSDADAKDTHNWFNSFLTTFVVLDDNVNQQTVEKQMQSFYVADAKQTFYEMLKNGLPLTNVSVRLQHNDEVNPIEVLLPYKEKINSVVSTTYLRSDLVSREISMRALIPHLELNGGIEKDSFNIQLQNPQKVEVSWYIYQGSELIKKGFGNELNFKSIIADRTQTYYVELLYSFGGDR